MLADIVIWVIVVYFVLLVIAYITMPRGGLSVVNSWQSSIIASALYIFFFGGAIGTLLTIYEAFIK